MMNVVFVGGACVYGDCVGGACVGVAFVSGVCVDGACVGGACVGGVKKGRSLKRGGVKIKIFNLSLPFVIPVNKMNLKSLPPLNHIRYKSKELYLLLKRF